MVTGRVAWAQERGVKVSFRHVWREWAKRFAHFWGNESRRAGGRPLRRWTMRGVAREWRIRARAAWG